MFNTYGLHAINRSTFNQMFDRLLYPKEARDIIVTALRINNAVFNIAGYVPQARFVSGCARMAVWSVVLSAVLAIGERNPARGQGLIIDRWYDEAICTAIAQISRGALEVFAPFAWKTNLALDVIATPFNFLSTAIGSIQCAGRINGGDDSCPHEPHQDANYPLLFSPLYLA